MQAKESTPKDNPLGSKIAGLVINIAIVMFVPASLVFVGYVQLHSMPILKGDRSSPGVIAFDAILLLAVLSFVVYLLRMRLQLKPGWARWLRRLAITFYIVGISPYVLFAIPILETTCPRFHVFFSDSHELKYLYGKCQTIKKGQTINEVRVIMSEFQISEQTPTDLYFNTPNYLTYGCGVHFSHEAVPHVISIDFILD